MKDNRKQEQEINFVGKTLTVFVAYYNRNIPATFPQATEKSLRRFQDDHPNLFDESKLWTIDKHRKHLMDWLLFYREPA